ncbi:hypothetical protein [Halalkalibacter alkalisediminis]|uniref:Uncharacterized protein n=1 Tax=Halalkalibacter alkalisediminis TaxID=935616 RepID=A0ABV6NJN1_9BACI|nr:hypothetical protein [Halalkalibacter alkalisediminis]
MLIGRILNALGVLFIFYCGIMLVTTFFTDRGNFDMMTIGFFGLLNGFIAMEVGHIVIRLHYKDV